ncbi:MAG: ABC transporter permease [Bacteroidota bacterium]
MSAQKDIHPPQLATRLLQWLLKPELAEEVLGDLEEKYWLQIDKTSKRKADLNYWYQSLNYLRPFAIKRLLFTDLNPFFMFNSYFKIAWRNLFKQKLFSFINVTGMSLGLCCFILIALYIQYEMSYESQHEKADRIYRLAQHQPGNEFRGTDRFAIAPVPIAPSLVERFPEVEAATTNTQLTDRFWLDGKIFYEQGLYADTALFDIFTYPIIEGDVQAALRDKSSIILTQSMAQKYFGKASPIGKVIEMNPERQLTVKAVIEDIPDNQHYDFSYIVSIENYEEYVSDKKGWKWANNSYSAYVLLPEGYDYHELEKKMSVFDEDLKYAYRELPFTARFFLQPLKDIRLYSQLNFERKPNGDIRYIYLAISIAIIILLLALINYMNLATARFRQRAREVGVRKVLGARRGQLVSQFLLESLLITIISFGIATGLANLLLPLLNDLLGLTIPFELIGNQMILIGFLIAALTFGALSGLYPALMSSAVSPVRALKNKWFKHQKESRFFRNTLIVGQFTAAIVLAISSVLIYQQLQYINTKKLGYNRDQVVYVPYRNQNIMAKASTIRNELLKHPNIEKVAITSALPLNTYNQGIVQEWEGNEDQREVYVYRTRTDYHYLDLFEIPLVEGRNFSLDHPSDSMNTYILNEAAVKALGWETAVGKSFRGGKVIGVVKNFHFQPLDFSIEPMFITFYNETTSYYYGQIAMKINMDDWASTTAHIQSTLGEIMPEIPFKLRYMDESYAKLYASEQRFGHFFNIFSLLALFIACIGLFGLVTHHIMQRTKEIGIRKVLGATVFNIVNLVTKDFLKLVALSALLAVPLSWWGMNSWLEDFAYRIEISWWVFALVGGLAIAIALATIGLQSIKAATANPVDSIQSE